MASWSMGASGGGVDATYGQRSVFGAVGRGVVATAPADDVDLECEDEQAALAYLAGVQAEARKIPHVVLAPTYGPQAFPPSERPKRRRVQGTAAAAAEEVESRATINKKRRRRRRQRHWDELDGGGVVGDGDAGNENGRTGKRRRLAAATMAPALSYDDDGEPGTTTTAEPTTTATTGYSGRTVRTYDELDTETDSEETDGSEDGDDNDDDDDDDAYEPRLDRGIYDNGVGDARGFYQDGAYIAAASSSSHESKRPVEEVTGADDTDPDDAIPAAYRARLLAHFAALRTLLRRSPPAAAVAALPPDHDTAVGQLLRGRTGEFRRWLTLLQTTDPLPVQVAALDTIAVLRLLRVLLRGGLLRGDYDEGPSARTSCWLWALLARLPSRGELDHLAIGCLRDVAKAAVQRLVEEGQGQGQQTAAQEEEKQGEEEGGGEEGELDLDDIDIAMDLESLPDEEQGDGKDVAETTAETTAEATAAEEERDSGENAAAGDDDEADDVQQRATLEMVLAIVGEFYGQRDLLAFRAWP